MTITIRDNADKQAKCRCGRPFKKVAVVTGEQPPRYIPYFCDACDRPPMVST